MRIRMLPVLIPVVFEYSCTVVACVQGHACVRTLLHAGVSGHEFQLEITAQSSSRIFLELDWAVDRKLD